MRILVNLLCAAVLATTSLSAAAVHSGLPDKKFVYRADGKKLAEVLQDFAASVSVPVVVDPAVDGTVSASFNSTPEIFLNAISKTYGVIWYFDGVTLFVYPSRVMQSRLFRMRGFDRNQVREMLDSFGQGDPRFPLRFNDADQTVFVYGPPRHIELVTSVLDALEQGSRERSGGSILVVPLKYAVAADRLSGANRLPGLATTLNNVFSGAAGGLPVEVSESVQETLGGTVGLAAKRRAVEQTYGFKAPGADNASARKGDGKADGRDKAGPDRGALHAGQDERPLFQADEATNSIIINAVPERMKQYEALVHRLDVAQHLVEIEATIIDVSTDEFDALGIEWDFTREGRGSLAVAPGAAPLAPTNITTLVADAGRRLLTRIRALEGNGKARIVARPKVLGSANRTASMTDKRIASVKVAGNLDANLFTIEAGTTLEVQPQIIPYEDRREVKLTLFIQDGNFESAGVDQVPIVKRTEIRTEATMREGESLLIGGISVESEAQSRSGLPGLSRAPVVGGLFRSDEATKRRSERLFLLTPKVIQVEGARPVSPIAAASPASPAVPAVVPPVSVAVQTVGAKAALTSSPAAPGCDESGR